MRKAGSRESGSNCERTKLAAQAKKKKGTVRQPKRPSKQQKPPEIEKEKAKGSVRKKPKSNSTTVSSDNNKYSDKCNSKESSEHPDDQSTASPNNRRPQTPNQSKEETSNLKTSVEQPKSTIKSTLKTSEENEEVTKKEETGVEKEDKKFNMQLAQMFFKRMMDAQRTSRNNNKNRDENLEVMPNSIYLPPPTKAKRSPSRATRKPRTLDTRIFKPNGDPVWIYTESKEEVEMEDGVKTRCPDLFMALKADGIAMEDGKQWIGLIEKYGMGDLDKGIIQKSIKEFNPYGTFSELEDRSAHFFRRNSVIYYTMSNLLNLSKDAIDRFSQEEQCTGVERRRKEVEALLKKASKEENDDKEKTCVVTSITFNMDSTFSISYDRRRPILSIQKFRQKYQRKLLQEVEKARKTSREGSKERTSKENA